MGLGTGLENYDWVLYGLMAPTIAPLFFPGQSPAIAVLSTLAVFAVGFAMRPVGAVILGTMADRLGRKRLLLVTISMMAGASLLMGLLPTYATIGIWAPVLLVALRMAQGLAMGAEQPVAFTFVSELGPKDQRASSVGVLGAFIWAGVLSSSLVPLLVRTLFGDEAMQSWAWRIPFLLGGVLGVVVIWLRSALHETHQVSVEKPVSVREVWKDVFDHRLALLATIFVIGSVQAYFYGWYSGLPARAQTLLGIDPSASFTIVAIFTVSLMLLSPVVGKVADRFGITRVFVTLQIASIPSLFLLLVEFDDALTYGALFIGGGVVLAGTVILGITAVSLLMPSSCRATGLATGYGLGVAGFAGTTPFFIQWVSMHDAFWLFPVTLATLLAVSVVLYLMAVRRTGTY